MTDFRRILVTGGAGFIGSNFVRRFLARDPDAEVVNLDALTYAGNLASLEDLREEERHHFVRADIRDPAAVAAAFSEVAEPIQAVVHFAAESHVDRSIEDPGAFLGTNIIGTQVLLDAARNAGVERFVHVSTDEVYGSLGPEGLFTETSALDPSSPYAASKAGSDLLVLAYVRTFGLDAVVTRCTNNYGPYQFPEKLIPLFVTNAMADQPLPLYGDGLNVRDWIYVEDHCDAVETILQGGRSGEVYNISSNNELNNREITAEILQRLGKPETLIRRVTDRPGHDRRYALDASKLRDELGWKPAVAFGDGIAQTIAWYQENAAWWQAIKAGDYQNFYDVWYGERLKSDG